jgi:transglutaminase-like putative cysteine protease
MSKDLLTQVPSSAQAWVQELVSGAQKETLDQFLIWHSPESLKSLFSWTPNWSPPKWRIFIQHGIPDWPPVLRKTTAYISSTELHKLRAIAREVTRDSNQEEAAYRLFRFVNERVKWGAIWGAASPLEILRREEGGSLHIAQLYSALLRTLFLPARLVEEVALIPEIWRHQAEKVWEQSPRAVCLWMGNHVFYHPFCEVRIGVNWVPVDPQRGQFGAEEMQQHLRVPKLLKLVTRTWEDYGSFISRTRRYTLDPLIKKTEASCSRSLGKNLRFISR